MITLNTMTAAERAYMARRLPRTYRSMTARTGARTPPAPVHHRARLLLSDRHRALGRHRHGAVKATRLTRLAGKIARNRVATGWYQRRCGCICRQLAAISGHSWSELISKRRSRDLARTRQAGMYLLLTHTNMNLPQVGKLFGGRDHSTVVHARNKVTARPGDFAGIIETIERQLGVR